LQNEILYKNFLKFIAPKLDLGKKKNQSPILLFY